MDMVQNKKASIGVVGLGVMGANLARNFASKGIATAAYNRTWERTEEFLKNFESEMLFGFQELEDFVMSLEKPRRVLLMVQAGPAVDAVIAALKPFLEKDDIIIDGGNTDYKNTIRRTKELDVEGWHFVGMGVSGGEEGALLGPSLMPGGSEHSWKALGPLLEKIAARDFSGGACVTHIGTDGAGHFVKMVHNGIEYAVMQLMAEAYDLLRKVYGYEAGKIAEIFEEFQNGKLKSFLFEIAVPVLKKKDGVDFLIDKILDKAGQKGTGAWTVIDALRRGVDLSIIAGAVSARSISAEKNLRVKMSEIYWGDLGKMTENEVRKLPIPENIFEEGEANIRAEDYPLSKSTFKHSKITKLEMAILEKALYAGMTLCYAQGLYLIQKAAAEQGWKIQLAEVCRIWQGGCIIRSELLTTLTSIFLEHGELPHLFLAPQIQGILEDSIEDLRKAVTLGLEGNVPLPCFGASLAYLQSMTSEFLPANLIQGLRDFFGAHTYERIDREGSFHTEWAK